MYWKRQALGETLAFIGFVLLHKGVQLVVRAGHAPPPFLSRHGMGLTVFIPLLYTLLILARVKFKVLQPLRDYLPQSARP